MSARRSVWDAVDRWRHTPAPDDGDRDDRDDEVGDELADREEKP